MGAEIQLVGRNGWVVRWSLVDTPTSLLWGEVKSISSAMTIFYQTGIAEFMKMVAVDRRAVLCNICFRRFSRKRTHDFHQYCPETGIPRLHVQQLKCWGREDLPPGTVLRRRTSQVTLAIPTLYPVLTHLSAFLLYKLLSRQQHLLLNFVSSELKLLLMNTASHFDIKRHITSGNMFSK